MLTVGEILKNERENKSFSLLDIEKKIKVREKYLQEIEKNNWSFFSSRVYIEGIIKNYSKILGIDQKKILAFFRRDYEKKEDIRFKKRVAEGYLTPETKKFLKLGSIIIIVFFISYFIYQLKVYFSPPHLLIISPKTNNFTVENRIKLVGKTEKDAMITITGERIYQNKDGIFTYELSLNEGKNKLSIELTGANGKKTTVEKIFIKKTPK